MMWSPCIKCKKAWNSVIPTWQQRLHRATSVLYVYISPFHKCSLHVPVQINLQQWPPVAVCTCLLHPSWHLRHSKDKVEALTNMKPLKRLHYFMKKCTGSTTNHIFCFCPSCPLGEIVCYFIFKDQWWSRAIPRLSWPIFVRVNGKDSSATQHSKISLLSSQEITGLDDLVVGDRSRSVHR